jgi:hypothetical protein
MTRNVFSKFSLRAIILVMVALSIIACRSNREDKVDPIELSDLVGTWEFANTIENAWLLELIGGQWQVTLWTDLTFTRQNESPPGYGRFAFSAELFRMIVHRGVLPHLNYYFVFEGVVTGAGLVSGTIYNTGSPASSDPWSYAKGTAIGFFSARRL